MTLPGLTPITAWMRALRRDKGFGCLPTAFQQTSGHSSELPDPSPKLALVHAELGCALEPMQPVRLNTLHSLPLELVRKMPALLLLHQTLLCRSEDLSRVSTKPGQDQLGLTLP
jgi:hypothetical protein